MARLKTDAEFKAEVAEKFGEDYVFIETYVNMYTKIKARHKCGAVISIEPRRLYAGRGCRECRPKRKSTYTTNKKKTPEEFIEEVFSLVGDEYTFLQEYVNRAHNLDVRHEKCGTIYSVRPGNFLSGSRCLQCQLEAKTLSVDEVKNRIKEHLGDEYELAGEYKNSQVKTKLYHSVCNTTFEVRVDDVIQKHSGCPVCVSSRGEEYVRSFLNSISLEFTEQKRFTGLTDKLPLSFDFYVPKLEILIEYQGSQHYIPKTFGGISLREAQDNLEKQIKHDNMKRDFAKSNNLILIEVPYKLDTLSKVSEFLSKELAVKQRTL